MDIRNVRTEEDVNDPVGSLACPFVLTSIVARISRTWPRLPPLLLPIILLFLLFRYSYHIWRLIERANEHEDLFDDVISNNIFQRDEAGISA